jgi:hypothetical protein
MFGACSLAGTCTAAMLETNGTPAIHHPDRRPLNPERKGSMQPNERFPADIVMLNKMDAEQRTAFEKFMNDLDAEHARLGAPYGLGSLWQITGAECWLAFHEDGMSPATALEEDMLASYD